MTTQITTLVRALVQQGVLNFENTTTQEDTNTQVAVGSNEEFRQMLYTMVQSQEDIIQAQKNTIQLQADLIQLQELRIEECRR
ncbi:MAG: hypothetical protein GY787_02530 [Alteromonadales bacterium]|nr:hypothetical protein [Alteromonadales bacterium]